VLILQGLTAFLLVTVHSKEFIAHGKSHWGLTLVPRLASVENKKRQQDAGGRNITHCLLYAIIIALSRKNPSVKRLLECPLA